MMLLSLLHGCLCKKRPKKLPLEGRRLNPRVDGHVQSLPSLHRPPPRHRALGVLRAALSPLLHLLHCTSAPAPSALLPPDRIGSQTTRFTKAPTEQTWRHMLDSLSAHSDRARCSCPIAVVSSLHSPPRIRPPVDLSWSAPRQQFDRRPRPLAVKDGRRVTFVCGRGGAQSSARIPAAMGAERHSDGRGIPATLWRHERESADGGLRRRFSCTLGIQARRCGDWQSHVALLLPHCCRCR